MKKYDLIVPGLAKSGSTATFEMLKNHPQLQTSYIKEPIDHQNIQINNYFFKYFLY